MNNERQGPFDQCRLVYFTASTWDEITTGPTANYYDLHLRNLASCGAGLGVLHLGSVLPLGIRPHPRIPGVWHSFSDGRPLTLSSLALWGLAARRLGLGGRLIYVPYAGYNSVVAWFWRRTTPLRVYQRLTYTPYRNSRYAPGTRKTNAIAWLLETAAIRGADWIGVGSGELADYVVGRGIRRGRLGLTTNLIETRALPVKEEYALFSPPRLITVSRLDTFKRIDWILQALQGLDVELDLYGDGPDRSRLEGLARQSGVRARFHGNIPNIGIGARLAESDLFVFASVVEGVPKSLLEAQGVGLPVVACSAPGVCEWLQDGRGLLTEAAIPALREGIQRLLRDEPLRSALGREARRLVNERHNPETALAQDRAAVLNALALLPGNG